MQDAIEIDSNAAEIVILTIITLVSMAGNVCLWIIVLQNRDLRTITNMFILKLSMADLFVGAVNMPVTVYAMAVGKWSLPDSACVAFGFTNMLTLSTSVLSLCNISINRLIMVVYPSKFKKIYTTRNAIFMIIGVISVSALLSSFPLFGWCEYTFISTHAFCFADWANSPSYSIFMISCCFGVPCCVMTVSNVVIFRTVRKSRRRVKSRVVSDFPSESVTVDDRSVSYKRSSVESDVGTTVVTQNIPTISVQDKQVEDQSTKTTKPRSVQSKVTITIGLCRERRRDSYSAVDDDYEIDIDTSPAVRFSDNLLKPPTKASMNNNAYARSPSPQSSPSPEPVVEPPKLKKTRSQTSTVLRRKEARRNEEIRLAFSLVIIVILFIVCWMPYCISMLLLVFYDGYVPREFHMFTLLIGYANSCCNPIIYGVMNSRFARGFKKLFCFWQKASSLSASGS